MEPSFWTRLPASIILIVLLTRHLEASTLIAMSANRAWTIWKLIIGVLNCLRSFAYLTASSSALCMIPTARVATKARDRLRAFNASLKPEPSGPSMRSLGTLTFSKIRSVVLESLSPILFSWAPTDTPGVFLSMIKAEIPLCPASGLVLKKPT